jgi:hypothetical protein
MREDSGSLCDVAKYGVDSFRCCTSGRFVLERQGNPSPKCRDLSIFDLHVHFHDLGDAQVADRGRSCFDRVPTGFLPGGGAFANDIDDSINALDFTLSHLFLPRVRSDAGRSW